MIMKKFSFGCLVLLLNLIQHSQAQTYVNLFREYLPQNYLKDEDIVEQMEYNFNQYAMTNPDLIYYYLNYLKSIEEQKIFNRDSNYYNILQYEHSISNTLNNNWVEEEIINSKILSEIYWVDRELESMLDEFRIAELSAPKNSIKLEIDKNLQKFFTYKCLTRDSITAYDEKADYQNLVELTIENFVSRLQTEYQAIKSNENYVSKLQLEDLLQYHFFSKGFSEGQNRKLDFNISEYLLALIDISDFMEYSGVLFGVSAELTKFEFPGVSIKETYLPFQEYTTGNTKSEIMFYLLSAGYRFKLKEYKAAFSHLDFSIGLSVAAKEISDASNTMIIDKYFFIWEGEPGNFTLLFDGTIDSLTWDLNNYFSITSNIYLPIFYLNQDIYFELGLHYQYLRTEYLINLHREINDQTATDPSILGPETETFSEESDGHLFGGSLTVNYSITKSLNIKGIISTLPSVQIGIEYLLIL
jgi:hypothetical protein